MVAHGRAASPRFCHHGEVVGTVSEAGQCPEVTWQFMGLGSASLPRDLSLTARGSSTVECLVTVKGENVLTQNLRDIGRRALPIEPMS